MKKILRDNKGSISALVVISVLLYSIVLTTAYMKKKKNSNTKSNTSKRSIRKTI